MMGGGLDIDAMAEGLLESLAQGERFRPLRSQGAAISLDTAYALQSRVVAHRKANGFGELAGYKCGLTSKTMQTFCGVHEPIAGRVLANTVRQSPAILQASDFVRLGLECEIALRVGKAVPVIAEDADPRILLDCVATVHAAFETIDDRDADYTSLDAASIVAEDSWNRGLVAGEGVDPRTLADLHDIDGVLRVDGAEAGGGNSNAVLGGPLHVLAWLARFLAESGEALQPGQWVMTGSIVPTIFPKPGTTATWELKGLPPVTATVA